MTLIRFAAAALIACAAQVADARAPAAPKVLHAYLSTSETGMARLFTTCSSAMVMMKLR